MRRRGRRAPAVGRAIELSRGGNAGSPRWIHRRPRRGEILAVRPSSNPRRNSANRAVRGASSRCEPDCAANTTVASSLIRSAPRAAGRRAPLRGARARPPRRRPGRRSSRRLAPRAHGHDPTAAAARPHASTARRPVASATVAARGELRRAASTRSRTGDDASPGAPASSPARGRGTVSNRSKRSSSARESFSR